jgi:hypothetical protein
MLKKQPARRKVATRTTGTRATRKAGTRTTAARKTAARAAATRVTKRTPEPTPPTALQSAVALAKGAVATVVALLPWTRDAADPIALLETDHRRFEALFEQGAATTTRAVKRRARILASLTAELNVHELIEEKVLYPALRPFPEAHDVVLEGSEEHHVADVLLRELGRMPPSDPRWAAKLKVLQESIEHHIQEEERRMFPTARGVLDGDALHALGVKMRTLRAKHGG